MKTFEEFNEAMETDEELKAKGCALFDGVTDEETKINLLVKLAVENGYDVSVEDFTRALAGMHKLSEEELEMVAGGREDCEFNHDCWFMFFACGYNRMLG